MASRGLVVAGLTSGSGKTTVTLGLLRAMRRAGIGVNAAKSGPDYIDAAFLAAASGASAVNLDSHAMRRDLIRHLAADGPEPRLLVEGVMGLFDGTDGGSGSTVSVAEALQAPVMLVLDARHQGQTAAALAAAAAQRLVQPIVLRVLLSQPSLILLAEARHRLQHLCLLRLVDMRQRDWLVCSRVSQSCQHARDVLHERLGAEHMVHDLSEPAQ